MNLEKIYGRGLFWRDLAHANSLSKYQKKMSDLIYNKIWYVVKAIFTIQSGPAELHDAVAAVEIAWIPPLWEHLIWCQRA